MLFCRIRSSSYLEGGYPRKFHKKIVHLLKI